jgi:hypothetical protein
MSDFLAAIEAYRSSPLLYFMIWFLVIATPIMIISAVVIMGRLLYLDRHPEHPYWAKVMKEYGLRMNPAEGARPPFLDYGYLYRDGR